MIAVRGHDVRLTAPLRIHRLTPLARLPAYATPGASGLDLRAVQGGIVLPGCVARIRTGLALEIPEGYEAQIRSRSGLASRGIIGILGTIDSDYRGEIEAMLHNTTSEPWSYRYGDRVAQLVIAPVVRARVVEVEELSDTERGNGGFGSTGVA